MNPVYQKGDVVQDIRNTDSPDGPLMIILDVIIEERFGIDYILLRGDKRIYRWEGWLIPVS